MRRHQASALAPVEASLSVSLLSLSEKQLSSLAFNFNLRRYTKDGVQHRLRITAPAPIPPTAVPPIPTTHQLTQWVVRRQGLADTTIARRVIQRISNPRLNPCLNPGLNPR